MTSGVPGLARGFSIVFSLAPVFLPAYPYALGRFPASGRFPALDRFLAHACSLFPGHFLVLHTILVPIMTSKTQNFYSKKYGGNRNKDNQVLLL